MEKRDLESFYDITTYIKNAKVEQDVEKQGLVYKYYSEVGLRYGLNAALITSVFTIPASSILFLGVTLSAIGMTLFNANKIINLMQNPKEYMDNIIFKRYSKFNDKKYKKHFFGNDEELIEKAEKIREFPKDEYYKVIKQEELKSDKQRTIDETKMYLSSIKEYAYLKYKLPECTIDEEEINNYLSKVYDFLDKKHINDDYKDIIVHLFKIALARTLVFKRREFSLFDITYVLSYLQMWYVRINQNEIYDLQNDIYDVVEVVQKQMETLEIDTRTRKIN